MADTTNKMIIVGLDNTMKTAESLLASGYKVRIKYFDKADDVDNMWIVRRYVLQYEEDEAADGYPSTLAELFKDYDKPKYDPPTPTIKVDDDNVFDRLEVRKD